MSSLFFWQIQHFSPFSLLVGLWQTLRKQEYQDLRIGCKIFLTQTKVYNQDKYKVTDVLLPKPDCTLLPEMHFIFYMFK